MDPERPARFDGVDLRGARFERVDLTGADLHDVDLSGARIRGAVADGLRLHGIACADLRIDGDIGRLVVNGVDVAEYVTAELERRDPLMTRLRPGDADGFRATWTELEGLWSETVGRAQELAPELLHAHVDEEWSFTQTLRHLAFATDAWVARTILGDPAPWDPLDLPWDEMEDTPGIPRDRSARPSLTEVLDLRAGRQQLVREFLTGLTDDALGGLTQPVDGPGWPSSQAFAVRKCLENVLNEEYHHRLFAERDLALLAAGGTSISSGR